MSYDLTFWKQKQTCKLSASAIYGELMEGRVVDGLEAIPTAEFIKRIHHQFPGITTDGGLTFWEGGQRGMFELYSSDQHVHLCCRGIQLPKARVEGGLKLRHEFAASGADRT